MNVDRACWNEVLLAILHRISTAYAVSFDLELSGIPVRKRGHASTGRQTLQERYAEVKHAAETFHILQFGMTLIEEDVDNGRYLLRPYNFNLSPLVDENLGIDRNFTYSSGAVRFLLDHNYKMDSPFKWAIPYLTKTETVEAQDFFRQKNDRTSIPDIKLRDDDLQALEFMKRVRKGVADWLKYRDPDDFEHIVYGAPTGALEFDDENDPTPLSGFQKRLVHQIIRADFPQLISYGRRDCVSVQRRDPDADAEELLQFEMRLKACMYDQLGFRFISEALAGGSLDMIDAERVGPRIPGEMPLKSRRAIEARIKELEDSLKAHKTVLIGHNCFLDLVYIYRTFYGALPDTVEEFQAALHDLFPIVLDTKFVATMQPSLQRGGTQLFEVAEAMSSQKYPVIEDAKDHQGYDALEPYHEAGFDSYATAKVFLRLCASSIEHDDEPESPEEPPLPPSSPPPPPEKMSVPVIETRKRKKKSKSSTSKSEKATNTRFSHANAFDALQELKQEEQDMDDEDNGVPLEPVSAETPASTSNALPLHETRKSGKKSLIERLVGIRLGGSGPDQEVKSEKSKKKSLLPDWDADFWDTYANKLRVYGTREEICILRGKEFNEIAGHETRKVQ